MTTENLWLAIGLGGQVCFTMRFVVQWIASERQGRSIVPKLFWYFSFMGGVILLTYALYRRDLVFIIGQATGLLIYSRNLYFLRSKARVTHPACASSQQ